MNRIMAIVVVGLLVACAWLGFQVRSLSERVDSLERGAGNRRAITLDASGEPVLSDADKQRLDRDALELKHWQLEMDYIKDHARTSPR